MPAATAADAPPLDPPEDLFKSQGFLVGPYRSAHQEKSFLEQINIDPGNLKIGLIETPEVDIHNDVKEVLNSTIKLCESLGHSVESTKLNFSSEEISLAIVTIISANVAYVAKSQSLETNKDLSNDFFENVTLQMAKTETIFLRVIM